MKIDGRFPLCLARRSWARARLWKRRCPEATGDIPEAQEEIRLILRESHEIPRGAEDDFAIRNQGDIAEAAASTTEVMTTLLAAIASIRFSWAGSGS